MDKKHPYGFAHGKFGKAESHPEELFDDVDLSGLGDLAGQINEQAPAGQQAETPQNENSRPEFSLESLAALAKAQVCPNCPEKKNADDIRLRALAEVENTKKRLSREKEEQTRFAAESVLSDILPALDNLDLALEHAQGMEACKNFVIGVEMTKKLLLESLKRHGLEALGQAGDPFDPAVHEAVNLEANPDFESDQICLVMSKGYKLKDRLLRPARVVVCKR